MKQHKLLPLESLRGIAAISVALYHFNTGSHFNNTFVSNAWLMVDFFFVLSGFVIALNYIDNIKSFKELLTFYKKRFFRLYPLHLIMLIVFVCIEFAKYIAEVKFGLIANNRAFSANNLQAFAANFVLLQNWTLSEVTFNKASWSISAEFITYAIFGSLILISNGKRILMAPILFFGVVIFGFILKDYGMGLIMFLAP